MEEILPGCRLMVYDPYRNGQRGKGNSARLPLYAGMGLFRNLWKENLGEKQRNTLIVLM